MLLKIDHVTIAGPDLEAMRAVFASVGLATDYGGSHSNDVTHMALLGFPDGSYIELISTLEPGNVSHVFWAEFIAGGAGPCAWAVEVSDVPVEVDRLSSLGVPVDGSSFYFRERPDGARVEWDLAFVGEGQRGAKLPFIIKDRTPRQWRVSPSASVGGLRSGLPTGVGIVVLGVRDQAESVELFREVYGLPEPQPVEVPEFDASLMIFPDSPVSLAVPSEGDGWLARRLERFGESPCAYLLATDDLEASMRRFGLVNVRDWLERRVAWCDPARLKGIRLGFIA